MKTTILTFAILTATLFGASQTASAATNNNDGSTILPEVSQVNKIEVHGNVELYVSNGDADQVKVYNSYYAENALVQNQDGVLRISSYNDEKLVVWVTAEQVSSLSLYDNAEVKSFGNFSALDINVDLHDNASARLNMNSFAANITLNDRAKADVSGTIGEGSLKYENTSYLNTSELAASNLVKTERFENMNNTDETLEADIF